MLKIKDIVELNTHDEDNKLSFAARYVVQDSYTFDVTVRSKNFSGTSHFCVQGNQIKNFIDNFVNLSAYQSKTNLADNDSDGFIEFEAIDNFGHIKVSAQIGGTHEDSYVKTEFNTDQTCLQEFIFKLQSLLAYKDIGEPE